MKITGHETDAMWRRYSIVDEDDIERALTAVEAYVGQRPAEKKDEGSTSVVALSRARRREPSQNRHNWTETTGTA